MQYKPFKFSWESDKQYKQRCDKEQKMRLHPPKPGIFDKDYGKAQYKQELNRADTKRLK